jgi:hypothetical protein
MVDNGELGQRPGNQNSRVALVDCGTRGLSRGNRVGFQETDGQLYQSLDSSRAEAPFWVEHAVVFWAWGKSQLTNEFTPRKPVKLRTCHIQP